MRTLLSKLFFIVGFTVIILFYLSDQPALAERSNGPQTEVARGDYYDNSINNFTYIWAFVEVGGDGKIYVRIYDSLERNNKLAEKCISHMKYYSSEDRRFIEETNRYQGRRIISSSFDITNPSISYTYKNPKIVFNIGTGTFLAIWIQQSREYGEQVVSMVIKYDRLNNNITSWDEPRILNQVDFGINTGSKFNNIIAPLPYEVENIDIDVACAGRFPYAIVTMTINKRVTFNTQIRLVPMYLNNGQEYHYNINDSRYFLRSHQWKTTSASLGDYYEGLKIFICSTDNSNPNAACILIWEIDRDLSNYQSQDYKTIAANGSLSEKDPPIFRRISYVNKNILLYTYLSNSDGHSHIRAVSLDYNYYQTELLAEIDTGESIGSKFNPKIGFSIRKKYESDIENFCSLTFQLNYKITLDGRDINFNYIFGKNIPLDLQAGEQRNLTGYFLISSGRPTERKNKGILHLIWYWEESLKKILVFHFCTLFNTTYNANLRLDPNNSASDCVSLIWDPYQPINRCERPTFNVYIITPDNQIRLPDTQSDTRATWRNTGRSCEIAAILCVSSLSPTLSGPLILTVGAGPEFRDSDGDGLTDAQEIRIGTNPNDSDSDNDGLTDGQEYNTLHTNPCNPDSDADNLLDGEEINIYRTNPSSPDIINLAVIPEAGAVATASSNYPGMPAGNAIDANSGTEWASYGNMPDLTPWIQVSWNTAKRIKLIRLRDRTNPTDQITGGQLSFSDGSTVSVGALPNDGSPLTIQFQTKTVTWVKFQVTSIAAETQNPGLAEIEIYNN